jgi:hypothetical protein
MMTSSRLEVSRRQFLVAGSLSVAAAYDSECISRARVSGFDMERMIADKPRTHDEFAVRVVERRTARWKAQLSFDVS